MRTLLAIALVLLIALLGSAVSFISGAIMSPQAIRTGASRSKFSMR